MVNASLSPELLFPASALDRNAYFGALQQTHGNQFVQRMIKQSCCAEAPLIQRQVDEEEEEVVQGKTADSIQRQIGEEEDEPIQAKLTIGQPGDKYEQEADRVAEQVMQMPEPSVQRQPEDEEDLIQPKPLAAQITPLVQRQSESEEEELLQGKALSGRNPTAGGNLEARINAARTSGQPLPRSARAFFEPRFGADFSDVRVHNSTEADALNRGLNARAFTTGKDIFFRQSELSPDNSGGRELLAHELTHVVQQSGSNDAANSIQQTVSSRSHCPAGVHGAPADPLAALTRIDALAQTMALGASGELFLESLTFDDPTFGPSNVFDAYRDWFGTARRMPSGSWRSRFRAAPFATEDEAIAHEMRVFSNRFRRIHDWLARNIRYRCPGTRRYTIPGCAAGRCAARTSAETCGPSGSRTMGICPGFWAEANDQVRAGILVHEAIHPLFHFLRHPTRNVRGRGRNPGCYEGFLSEIYSFAYSGGDCSIVVP